MVPQSHPGAHEDDYVNTVSFTTPFISVQGDIGSLLLLSG